MSPILRAALVASLLAFPVAAVPQGAATPLERLQDAVAKNPSDPALLFFLALQQARGNDAKAATASLRKLAGIADGYLPSREDGFEKVWNDPQFAEAVRALEAKLPRLDFAPVAFSVEDPALVPEGLAYDAPAQAFYMGSIAERRILRIDAEQHVTEFAGSSADLDAVLGLAVDAPRRRLYAVSTSALRSSFDKLRSSA